MVALEIGKNMLVPVVAAILVFIIRHVTVATLTSDKNSLSYVTRQQRCVAALSLFRRSYRGIDFALLSLTLKASVCARLLIAPVSANGILAEGSVIEEFAGNLELNSFWFLAFFTLFEIIALLILANQGRRLLRQCGTNVSNDYCSLPDARTSDIQTQHILNGAMNAGRGKQIIDGVGVTFFVFTMFLLFGRVVV